MKKMSFFIIVLLTCVWFSVNGQSSLGVSGLLTVPSAEMQPDGTFMMGGNYLPNAMLPARFGKNTGNYYFNLTFLPFMEICYRCTLLKVGERKEHWQQDRSVSLRLQTLKEKKYIPSVVVGSNDAFTTYALNPFSRETDNRLFGSVYGVLTKNVLMGTHVLGLTAGYYLPIYDESSNKGVFGGIRYTPVFFPLLNIMADYDGKKISTGFSFFLFKHFRAYIMMYDFKNISAGVRYELMVIRK